MLNQTANKQLKNRQKQQQQTLEKIFNENNSNNNDASPITLRLDNSNIYHS